jgi:hypothetical protein
MFITSEHPVRIKLGKRGPHGKFPDTGRRVEMPKRFIDPALFGLECLVLLIWQLSGPVFAQAPAKNALEARGSIVTKAVVFTASEGDWGQHL